jgi:hypothetical protein
MEISGGAISSFALLLHEFATNSTKHGALSVEKGQIQIHCTNHGENVIIVWTEYGGDALITSLPLALGPILAKPYTVVELWHGRGSRRSSDKAELKTIGAGAGSAPSGGWAARAGRVPRRWLIEAGWIDRR